MNLSISFRHDRIGGNVFSFRRLREGSGKALEQMPEKKQYLSYKSGKVLNKMMLYL